MEWKNTLMILLGSVLLIAIGLLSYASYMMGHAKGYFQGETIAEINCNFNPDCLDGCIYAEWARYGYKQLKGESSMYTECAQGCWNGDAYFVNKTGEE